MADASATPPASERYAERLVRYRDLRPCTTAFIDTRTPGSAQKENFTIIGPGVAENPDQYVHIDLPHGFNIGGARQPPGCVNSQHSHETAEVFVIHTGRWAFRLGPNCEDGEVMLEPGDTISIPTQVFRGFENVGDDEGFMFAVLGGDDPGRVTWAPYVFESAKAYGLILCEDGSLVDTARGETMPKDKKAMPATTAEQAEALRTLTAQDLAGCVVSHRELRPADTSDVGLPTSSIIGAGSAEEELPAGRMAWPHGFVVRHLAVEPGVTSKRHARREEEVILMHAGELALRFSEGDIVLGPGDVFTTPIGSVKSIANLGSQPAEAYVVRGGDHPAAAQLFD